jgi:ribosomal protein L11 methyltransferase
MQSSPLFRWSKRVSETEVETWENRLTIEGISYVVEKAVGRERWQFSVYNSDRAVLETMKKNFGGGVVRVRPEDWQPAATGDTVRLRIRDRFVVVEETDAADLKKIASEYPGREVLSFPPQMAFGTGGHQTTANCLRQLVDESAKRAAGEWNLLDLGCGSGILSVAGTKLGARHVVALENDPMALNVARENARRHGVHEAIDHIEGDAIAWTRESGASGKKFDIIAANLFSDLLVALFPQIPKALAPEGTVIVSGFLTTQARAVNEAGQKAGIELTNFIRRGKWVTAVGQHA